MPSPLTFLLSGGPRLSSGERVISTIAGLVLAASGAKPRPNILLNFLALGAGSYLAYRGATGYCPVKAALAQKDAGATGRAAIEGARVESGSSPRRAAR